MSDGFEFVGRPHEDYDGPPRIKITHRRFLAVDDAKQMRDELDELIQESDG